MVPASLLVILSNVYHYWPLTTSVTDYSSCHNIFPILLHQGVLADANERAQSERRARSVRAVSRSPGMVWVRRVHSARRAFGSSAIF